MDRDFKILAIDGGGIRGVFAAQILKRIKEELKIEFCKTFDIIAGTSTGSIIAGAISIDYPIEKITRLYQEEGRKIFSRNYSDSMNWFNWKSYIKSKYDKTYLTRLLKDIFRDLTLSQTKARLIIPCSDISNGNVYVFKSNYDPNFVRDKDVKMADAILASCSAPHYFNPTRVKDYLLADGGLWANNPTLIAVTEAMGRRFNISKENIKVLSIGTGLGKKYYNPKDVNKEWGFKQWGTGLVATTMNLQSINVDNIVRFIIKEDNLLRINFETDCEVSLDDIDCVENLIVRADEQFTYSFEKINNFFKEG